MFEDIREMRDECLLNGLIGNTKLNKISIEMMAPKAEELQALKDQKTKRNQKGKSVKSSHTNERDDEINMQD